MITGKEIKKPSSWTTSALGDICSVVSGSTPSSGVAEYWGGDIVWITPTDLGKLQDKYITGSERYITYDGYKSCGTELIPPGSVVLSSRAPIGHLGIAQVPLCTNQGCKSFIPGPKIDGLFLYFILKAYVPHLQKIGSGATFAEVSKSQVQAFEIPLPPLDEQRRIVAWINEKLEAVERARSAAEEQIQMLDAIVESYLRASLSTNDLRKVQLKDCLVEVKQGIGDRWHEFPVIGATRDGLAPAKENVGKKPERYKPVEVGTIFYNPMRINIGSIAMLDEGEKPGITSPDYVVLRTRDGIIHPRWFYFWLRSSYGEAFIKTFARGAVRERMLFNRLSPGEIFIPSWETQSWCAEKLKLVKQLKTQTMIQISMIEKLPEAFLKRAFTGKA